MSIGVNVYGMGFVGLTLAVTLAKDAELKVTGIDIDGSKVLGLLDGTPPFFELNLQEDLRRVHDRMDFGVTAMPAQYHIVCIGTPNVSSLGQLDSCVEDIVKVCRPGDTIIIRSTVPVGTTKNYAASYSANIRWAYAPERTLAGNALHELTTLPQLVGGDESATALFERITKVIRVSSTDTAEMIKLISNCWRAYTFGFANQLAVDCDALGVDVYEVLEKGAADYPRFNIPKPGFSMGPCLTKDPSIYASKFPGRHLYEIATRVNFTSFLRTIWVQGGSRVHGRLGLLGAAFKATPTTSDTRDSPLSVLKESFGVTPIFWDPSVSGSVSYREAWEGSDLVVVGTELPKVFEKEPMLDLLSPNGLVIDFWNTWPQLVDPQYKVFGRP